MIVSEKSHQNLSEYIQFLINKHLYSIKKRTISSEKMRNSGNYNYMIMLTRSSERIFNPSRYTGM